MATKVNLAKAFDRVEWKLLNAILSNLGFASTFIDGISQVSPHPLFLFSFMVLLLSNLNPLEVLDKEILYVHFFLYPTLSSYQDLSPLSKTLMA